MHQQHHVGQRISFDSAICTVRYIGAVQGTSKEWLGVEWDDPSRGKHNGQHQGLRYFDCISSLPTAGSFVRPSRPSDPEQSFVEAVRQKYASDVTLQPFPAALDKPIEISGKIVEEIGFEKVTRKLAQIHQLRIVLVDGFRINNVETESKKIRDICPAITELDLSRNLFETLEEIVQICGELNDLRSLRLNGNRFRVLSQDLCHARRSCKHVRELELDDMLLSWEALCLIIEHFERLTSLCASLNCLKIVSFPLKSLQLTSLKLEFNAFTSLMDLAPLSEMQFLERIYLKGNQISQIARSSMERPLVFGQSLHYVDLSHNNVSSWTFVDGLVECFPGLTALRFSNNPVYQRASDSLDPSSNFEEGFMFTVARIKSLMTLNFSNISPAERTNAEIFYLSCVAKELAKVPESEEYTIIAGHVRYEELCEVYGTPTVARTQAQASNMELLEARLIKFSFYVASGSEADKSEEVLKVREIPKGFDVYRVKGVVARMFDLKPRKFRMIWETGEWDPIAGYEDVMEDNSDQEQELQSERKLNTVPSRDGGKWMRREVEIDDSTRQIGFCVDGNEAIIRLELR